MPEKALYVALGRVGFVWPEDSRSFGFGPIVDVEHRSIAPGQEVTYPFFLGKSPVELPEDLPFEDGAFRQFCREFVGAELPPSQNPMLAKAIERVSEVRAAPRDRMERQIVAVFEVVREELLAHVDEVAEDRLTGQVPARVVEDTLLLLFDELMKGLARA